MEVAEQSLASQKSTGQTLESQKSLWHHAKEVWGWLAIGCVGSFELASVLLTGWPRGLIPNFSLPYTYRGDGLAILWLIRRTMEGWVFDNPRSGFPFGSNFLDYPGSDAANFALFKLLGWLTHSPFAAFDLFLLLSFPAVFAVTMVAFRSFGLRDCWSFVGAMLFTFAPFHFARFFMGHDLYLWYMCVPLFVHYGRNLFMYGQSHADLSRPRNLLSAVCGVVIVSCFGVYYAFFGLIVVCISGAVGAFRTKRWRPIWNAILLSLAVGVVVITNLAPNIVYRAHEGANPEVAARLAWESEWYSLKTIHLLLPQPEHRITALGEFTRNYDSTFPLSNTNSSLGIIGVMGFVALLISAVAALAGKRVSPNFGFASIITLSILLVSTVGGFNVIFALLVSPLIRGWDRISIFINCTALLAAMFLLQRFTGSMRRHALAITSALVLTIGILDQTPKSFRGLTDYAFAKATVDRAFIRQIEATMPAGAAVYDLPYIAFPESAPLNRLEVYELGTGFINSDHLRWSFGGMAGRQGDRFFRELSKHPIQDQLSEVRRLGFSGIYIDRRGFADNGTEVEKELAQALGHGPALVRSDGVASFFDIRK
ncbi:hypothetical protein AB4Y32_15885 [Paraburkholderia phymatum]|uniref:Uncharacterized protein n=1 Tax=Paraburkholderia phymatum TaxID=148447 RepID=A0ACC6U0Q0_9BURK